MGIDTDAAIMVGLERGDLEDMENLEDLIDNEDLETCPPYYDGSGDSGAVVGFCYQIADCYAPTEIEWDFPAIEKLKANFKKITGRDAKVWLSPMIW